MYSILKKAKEAILDILFPRVCVSCGKEGQYICGDCETFLGESSLICPVCSRSVLTGERHDTCKTRYGLDGLVSVWEYEGITKKILGEIKYRGITDAAAEITEMAIKTILKDAPRFGPFLFFISGEIDIAFTPMYKKKERERGFNQAELFAGEMAKFIGRDTRGFLKKIKDTASQTGFDKEKRAKNVKGSFAAVSDIAGRNVLLVDDIWTTGATLKECCECLKRAGARKVWGFTLARAA